MWVKSRAGLEREGEGGGVRDKAKDSRTRGNDNTIEASQAE